ncbi:MAG: pyrimidine dimer DNA glycosylase/endonuclease V, partial [Halomonas sp.]|nr:pyrimidine dimer DNA glycosylase/endonuclease V [Halomonas sp.]
MRLWSLHPHYLDTKGLLALWREGLLAQKVLLGQTRGYRNHPQLIRFKHTQHSVATIGYYLSSVVDEADRRGYSFDRGKIITASPPADRLPVTSGQVVYEFRHLLNKLADRSPEAYRQLSTEERVELHPL